LHRRQLGKLSAGGDPRASELLSPPFSVTEASQAARTMAEFGLLRHKPRITKANGGIVAGRFANRVNATGQLPLSKALSLGYRFSQI
jgi:hypothetical protein